MRLGAGARAAALVLLVVASLLLAASLRRRHVDFRDSRGRTPLQQATWSGDHAAMARLLAAGADPGARNEARRESWLRWGLGAIGVLPEPVEPDEVPPLVLAAARGDHAGMRMLFDAGARAAPETVLRAVHSGADAEGLRLLLQRAGPLNAWPSGGSEALAAALRLRRPDSVRLLLEAGADPAADPEVWAAAFHLCRYDPDQPHFLDEGRGGYMHASAWSLHYDERTGRIELADRADPAQVVSLRLLLRHGASPDLRFGWLGLLPVDHARWVCRFPDMQEAFMDVSASSGEGPDARLRAVLEHGDLEEARRALAEGADPAQRLHGLGMSLADRAKRFGLVELHRLLEEAARPSGPP